MIWGPPLPDKPPPSDLKVLIIWEIFFKNKSQFFAPNPFFRISSHIPKKSVFLKKLMRSHHFLTQNGMRNTIQPFSEFKKQKKIKSIFCPAKKTGKNRKNRISGKRLDLEN